MGEVQEIRFKGLLTDMDGFFVDSETFGIQVAIQVCRELGLGDLSEEEQISFIGVTDEKFYCELFLLRGRKDLSVEEALKLQFRIYESTLSKVPSFPDEVDFLQRAWLAGVPIALVSGSTRDQIGIILNAVGLGDAIPQERRVACEDCEAGKPSPEGYLKGANLLGLKAEDCVALEDATSGVRAARAAGSFVVAVRRALAQDISEANVVVSSLATWSVEKEGDIFVMRKMA